MQADTLDYWISIAYMFPEKSDYPKTLPSEGRGHRFESCRVRQNIPRKTTLYDFGKNSNIPILFIFAIDKTLTKSGVQNHPIVRRLA